MYMPVQGLVMPPRVAQIQVVVISIPNGRMSPEAKVEMNDQAGKLAASLQEAGVRVHLDVRDNYTPGWKYSHWELKVRAGCRHRHRHTHRHMHTHTHTLTHMHTLTRTHMHTQNQTHSKP